MSRAGGACNFVASRLSQSRSSLCVSRRTRYGDFARALHLLARWSSRLTVFTKRAMHMRKPIKLDIRG